MKKLYFFIGLLSANVTFSQIQSEDFEAASLPVGWTTNIVTGGVDWTFGSGSMSSGADFATNAAIFDDDAAGEDELDNTVQLLSPAVNLTTYSTVSLSFEYALQDYAGSGFMDIDVWNGTAWVQILTRTEDQNPIVVTFDVTSYINPAFQVRFTFDDEDEYGWGAGVDNFILTGVLGTNEFGKSKFTVSPNPTADIITINTTDLLTNMRIVDITGKTVQNIQDGTVKVDISTLAAGTYMLLYDTEGKHYSNRIVRK